MKHSQAPTFWPLGERQTAVQVHTPKEAAMVRKLWEGICIAYSVAGERLEVFQINRSLETGHGWIVAALPNAIRVYGGQMDKL